MTKKTKPKVDRHFYKDGSVWAKGQQSANCRIEASLQSVSATRKWPQSGFSVLRAIHRTAELQK